MKAEAEAEEVVMAEADAMTVAEAELANGPGESKYHIGRVLIPEHDSWSDTLYNQGSEVPQQSPCFGYPGNLPRRHIIDHAKYDRPPAGTAVTPGHLILTSWINIFIAGELALDRADFEEAERMFLLARDWTHDQKESSDRSAIPAHFTNLRLAHIARKKGNAQEAEKMYQEVLEALKAARTELTNDRFRHFRTHVALDVILYDLALICWKQHRHDEALLCLVQRVEAYQGHSGEFDYSLAEIEVDLANCLFYQKKISEAEKLYRHSAMLARKFVVENSSDLSRVRSNLAKCSWAREQYASPVTLDDPVETPTARAPWAEIIEGIDECLSDLARQPQSSIPKSTWRILGAPPDTGPSIVFEAEPYPAEMPAASDTHYYKQLIEWARDDLDSGIFSSAPRVLNEAFALGLLSAYLSKEATAAEIATVILSSVLSGRGLKDESINLSLEEKRAQLTFCWLSDSLMSEAAALINAMTENGKEALAISLTAVLQTPGYYGNENAFNVLVLLGPPAVPAMVQLMTGRFNHPGSNNQKLAAALHKIGDQFAMPEMVWAMEKQDDQNAQRCEPLILNWLGDCGESAVPHLVPYLGIFEVCQALEKIGPVAIPAIVEEVKRFDVNATVDWNIRGQANKSLTGHNAARVLSAYGEASIQPVLDAIKSTTGTPRQALLAMFGNMQPQARSIEAAPAICRAFLEDDNYFFASQALRSLGPSAITYVCDCFAHADRSVYPRMFVFLSSYGYSEIPLLTNCLSHPNPAAQANSAVAILKITGAEDDKAIKTLLALISSDADEEVAVVLEALVIGSERGLQLHLVPALLKTLQEAEPSVRLRAEQASGEISSRITTAIEHLMEFVALSKVEPWSEFDIRFLLQTLADFQDDWVNGPLTSIDGIIERLPQLTDATKKTLKAGEPLMRRAANRDPQELRARLSAGIDRLMQALSIYETAPAQQSATPEPQLPLMPTYSVIQEGLDRQFPNGMVVSRMGYQEKNEKGEYEHRVKEERAPVNFTAQPIKHRLSGNNPGQPTFFKRHIMLSITAGQEYRWSGGLGGHGRGLYTYDGEKLTYVEGDDAAKNIGEVLRVEALKLDQVDSVELSWFFCQTLVMGALGQHTVVEPSASQEPGSVITKPSVTLSENVWKVHFWTLKQPILGCCRGPEPVVPELCEHTVTISPQFDITYEEG